MGHPSNHYDEQDGCCQSGAPADAVVYRDERDCAGSHHDSAGGGAVLRIVERIEGEPAGGGSGPDGHAAGGVGAHRVVGRADLDQGGRCSAASAARGVGCAGDLVVHPKTAGDHLRHRRGELRHPASQISLSFRRAVSGAIRRDRRRLLGADESYQGGRQDRDPEPRFPHLRHRSARKGLPQVSAASDDAGFGERGRSRFRFLCQAG